MRFQSKLLVLSLLAVAAGCATPKEINGRKVQRTLWQNGKIVYVVEGDAEAMKRSDEEAKAASRGIVFKPLKSQ